MKLLRKWKAKRHGVPFEIKKFWPAGVRYVGAERNGMTLIWANTEIYEPPLIFGAPKPMVKDVVPVWFKDGLAHFYRIKGIGHASGSDHFIDPTEYHLEYVHSTPATLSAAS